ncbi:MAG: MauE/DoxX family redox-associated membrane protein [Acidobacteriota bacterium]
MKDGDAAEGLQQRPFRLRQVWESERLDLLLRISLGVLFVYASLDKLLHPLEFARLTAAYQILPEVLIAPLAALIPPLELLCGFLLVFGVWPVASLLWVGVLLGVFLLAVTQAYLRGLNIDCGCFSTGGEAEPVGLLTIIRDLILLGLWFKVFSRFWLRERNIVKGVLQ